MSWEKELDELNLRRKLAEKMGGEDKVARQKQRGKLTARERIDALLDPGSFYELGKTAGAGQYDEDGNLTDFTPTNLVSGRGRINERPVVVTADDFTVRGGSAEASNLRKIEMSERMAHELKLPLIRMIDGTGGGGSVKSLEDFGFTYVPFLPAWEDVVKNQKTVPVVAMALGATAGMGAARTVASHYSLMVKGMSQVFAAGPKVVAAIGEDVDREELGGAAMHTSNGVIDDEVPNEYAAFERARTFLSYLPSYAGGPLKRESTEDSVDRKEEELISTVPKDSGKVYSMRRVIEAVADRGTVFEMGKRWGRGVITSFVRMDGWPVALLASDPTFLGGSWTADTADKAKRFVELAEQFGLPVIHLVDNPGFMIGSDAERRGTIRKGVEAAAAVYSTTIPWATVIVRKAYGIAAATMSDHTRFQYRFAWPSGDWGSLPIAGGLEVAYRAELEKADNPEEELQKIKARLEKVTSPFRTAEKFMIEDIIDPRETRPLLCEFVNLAMAAKQ